MLRNKLIALLVTVLLTLNISAQNVTIYGKVTDANNKAIDIVAVALVGTTVGVLTNENGNYTIEVPKSNKIQIIYSKLGYQRVNKSFEVDKNTNKIQQNIILLEDVQNLEQISIIDKRIANTGIIRLDPKSVDVLPNAAGGGVEAMIKTMPGVSSNNELSSQYNVRGGNYDENLVYVNDVEIYRPFLMRSGQQEGLSFINSDMVSAISFSAGGFDAKYDDKMSSVLDIKYRKPTQFAVTAMASLLGASLNVEGTVFKNKFTHITGVRYKTSQYLLNSLEAQGVYRPSFLDVQTYLTYNLTKTLEVNFLGNFSKNSYDFIPESQSTSFGTFNEALNLYIAFGGKELDSYTNFTGALGFDFHPINNLRLKLISSVYNTSEAETYDIEGAYWLSNLDKQMAGAAKDSMMNIGIGAFLEHARNFLDARVYSISHKGIYSQQNNMFLWGIKFQNEIINDKINEWKLLDSAGYSIPYTGENISLAEATSARNHMNTNRFTSYFQDNYTLELDSSEVSFNGGVRLHYWDFNNEMLISPRFTAAYRPNWKRNVVFRFASGYYYQPPFYRELRNFDGSIVKDNKAQKSIHFVLGSDFNFMAWGRPFKLISEIYYKKLENLIPYEIDNIRLRYYADQRADGYATGLDMKVNGEFVEGVESWASLSIMQTKEDVIGDNAGYISRPADQLVNVGLFFQDYVPGNDMFKMHLNLLYGSGLPFGPPHTQRSLATLHMPSYKRVDIGFSALLKEDDKGILNKPMFKSFKSIWLSLEIFNLLGVNNTISYLWLTVVPNTTNIAADSYAQYAVPNRLTSRRINLKLIVKF